MKNLMYGFILLLAVFISSCSGSDEGSSVISITATYHQLDGGFYLVSDIGEKLYPEENGISYDLTDGDRVTVSYTILGEDPDGIYDYYIQINAINKMLMRDMFIFDEATTDEVRDSIGNNPIYLINAWIVDDYLTVAFEMPISNTAHIVNLVEDLTEDKTDLGATILHLKQNGNDIPTTEYMGWGVASFNISALKDQANSGETSAVITIRGTNTDGTAISYSTNLIYYFAGETSLRIRNIGLGDLGKQSEIIELK
ncbi:MAG: hypothetical protein ACK5MI_00110 [Mangrovibacterium sp.]